MFAQVFRSVGGDGTGGAGPPSVTPAYAGAGFVTSPPAEETFAKLRPAIPAQAGVPRPLDTPHGFPPARE